MASIKARLAAAAKAGGGAAPGVPDTDAVFAEYGATPHGGRTAETASEQKVPMPSTLKEQSYVPLAVARATIKRMTEDMQGMQSRHAELVGKVQAYYTDREEKSRQHYVEYIESMRDRANTRIQYYRSAATTLKQQLQEAEAGAARDKTAAAATAASAASQLDALKATVAAGDSENGQAKVALVEQHAREVEELRAELAAARAAPVPAQTVAPAAALAASSAPQPAADSGEAVAALHAAYAAFPSLKAQLAREANEKLDAREATIAALREQVAALQGQLARTGQGAIALAAAAEGAAASGGGDPQAAVRLAAAQEEVTRLQREVEALHAAPAQPLAQSDAEFLGKVVAWSSDPVRAARLTAATAPPDAAGVDPAAREAALAPFKAEVRSAAQEVQVTAENKAELSGQADELYGQYKGVKGEIKGWLADYAAQNGVEADKEAKKAIKDKYHAYDSLSSDHKAVAAQADVAASDNAAAQARLAAAQAALAAAERDFAAGRLTAPPPTASAPVHAEGGGDSSALRAELEAALREAAAAQEEIEELQGRLEAGEGVGGGGASQDDLEAAEEERDALAQQVAALQAEAASVASQHQLELSRVQAAAIAGGGSGGGGGGQDLQEDLDHLIQKVGGDIATAKELWKEKRKSEVCTLLLATIDNVQEVLGVHSHPSLPPLLDALATAHTNASADGVKASKAALELRKALDAFVQDAAALLEAGVGPASGAASGGGDGAAKDALIADLLAQVQAANSRADTASAAPAPAATGAGGGADPAALRKAKKAAADAEKRVGVLKGKVSDLNDQLAAAKAGGGGRGGAASSGPSAAEGRLKDALEKEKAKLKAKTSELSTTNTELKKLKSEVARLQKGSGAAASEAEKEVKRMAKQLEGELKKAAKAQDEAVTKVNRELTRKTKEADGLAARVAELEAALAEMKAERDALKSTVGGMGELQAELDDLRAQSAALVEAKASIKELEAQGAELAKLYREEQVKRKRLHNALEDMKGKIRVYARCRPSNKRERDLKSPTVISMPDDMTMTLGTDKGDRNFVYDHVFGPTSTQPEVYEEVDNLIQSAYDGYNVCIFAYGQTGSGKTFTMLGATSGGGELLGITPRAIARLFSIIEENADVADVTVSSTMVEIYNDQLQDLYFKVDHEKAGGALKPPKLEIKMDRKKRVFIQGSVMREATSPAEVLAQFDHGNGARKTGSTKMNAESSRSHLMFTIMIQVRNRATGKTSFGKLTLVDLAGSERVSKTGADAERLREAQSINKSLAALGNVINKLSSTEGSEDGPGHVPYRDNILTKVLQDGLGGSAKTLMFVNISPAKDNTEETLSSLLYAERVKKITNTAAKSEETKLVRRLKATIRRLRAGEAVHEEEEDDATASVAADGEAATGAG